MFYSLSLVLSLIFCTTCSKLYLKYDASTSKGICKRNNSCYSLWTLTDRMWSPQHCILTSYKNQVHEAQWGLLLCCCRFPFFCQCCHCCCGYGNLVVFNGGGYDTDGGFSGFITASIRCWHDYCRCCRRWYCWDQGRLLFTARGLVLIHLVVFGHRCWFLTGIRSLLGCWWVFVSFFMFPIWRFSLQYCAQITSYVHVCQTKSRRSVAWNCISTGLWDPSVCILSFT